MSDEQKASRKEAQNWDERVQKPPALHMVPSSLNTARDAIVPELLLCAIFQNAIL